VRLRRGERPRVRNLGLACEHVLGQRQHHRPRPAGGRRGEGARQVLGDPVGAVDLGDPFRERGEHPPVIDLLERLAVGLVGGDLADQKDQRRRVLERGVDADRGVRRARPARHEADPGPARQLAVGVGHVRGAGLVPADDQPDRRVVERVEHGEVALAGDAKGELRAVERELVDEDAAAATQLLPPERRRR